MEEQKPGSRLVGHETIGRALDQNALKFIKIR
jgi:hypothetical protein